MSGMLKVAQNCFTVQSSSVPAAIAPIVPSSINRMSNASACLHVPAHVVQVYFVREVPR